MKPYLFIISICISINYSYSQSYSRLIDIGVGNDNLIQDVHISKDSLILAIAHICPSQMQCTSISDFDLNSRKLKLKHLFETREIGNNHGLLVEPERKIISFHNDAGAFNGFFVHSLTNEYDTISFTEFFTDQDTIRFFNDGILQHKGDYYVWGEGANDVIGEPNGHIVKLDSTLTQVKDIWYYNRGTRRSHLNDLQVQPDGNMTFLVKSGGPIGSNTGRTDSLHFIKIDTAGNIINEITIEEGSDLNRNFYTLRNGNYVVMNFIETVFGRVQCLDHETGDVVWDWELPKGKFNEFNRFSIRDYVEMHNGDVVVCGVTQEILDGIWDDSRFTAIAARLSPEGELIWFRRFLVPNETNPEEKGPYHFDILTRVFEREDSTICFLGESTQFNVPPPNKKYAWILALDENDCYKGNCSDTIVIDKRLTNKLKFELGAKWTYQREWIIDNRVDFKEFEVTDTMTIDSLPCFVINGSTTFCTNGNQVLVPDVRFNGGFQLIYDFDVIDDYNFQCYDDANNSLADFTAMVDSITTELTSNSQLINVQYLRSICSDGLGSNKIYEGIGSSYGTPLYCSDNCNELADPTIYELTVLRCFENSTGSYRFVDFACDSTWLLTSVEDLDIQKFTLYPNPANGTVYVQDAPFDLKYRLTNIQGQVIRIGTYGPEGIDLPYEGIFFVTLISDDGQYTERVVSY